MAADIIYYRANGDIIASSTDNSDPSERAESVRTVFALWGGDTTDYYVAKAALFEFGNVDPLVFPSCRVAGAGKLLTTWRGQMMIDPNTTGLNFQLQDTTVEDIAFINDCWDDNEDGGCIGFLGEQATHTAIIRRCSLWCRDWTIFTWENSAPNILTIDDCDITTGRVGIGSENSGNGQHVIVTNCNIIGDASLSASIGETSNSTDGGVFGIVHRGGLLEVSDTTFTITGGSNVPRAASITDHGGGNSGIASGTQIVMSNITCVTTANGATRSYDLDIADADLQQQMIASAGFDFTLSRNFLEEIPQVAANILQAKAARIPILMRASSDHVTPTASETVSVTISKNGAAFGNPSAGVTTASPIGSGLYYVDMSTTDTNTLGPLIIKCTSSNCDPFIDSYIVSPLVDGKTVEEALQVVLASAAGLCSGAGTGTETYKGADQSTTRYVVTVDSSGNRTSVSYN